jgi:pimeloyl-ACP methyl ester carboxylesterase
MTNRDLPKLELIARLRRLNRNYKRACVAAALCVLAANAGCSDADDTDDLSTGSGTSSLSSSTDSMTATESGSTTDSTSSGDTTTFPEGWEACPEGLTDNGAQCRLVKVPLNWEQPQGKTIDLFLHRTLAAQSPAKGQIWLLDGGPGGSGEELAKASREFFGDNAAYDVYTLTHRGTGRSTLLQCEAFAPMGTGDLEDCANELSALWGDDLHYFNARQAARDVGSLVETYKAAGQSVNVYGLSYGTYLLQHYLKLYPNQANLVVLDGVLDLEAEIWFNTILAEKAGEYLWGTVCAGNDTCKRVMGEDPLATYKTFIDDMRSAGTVECPAFQALSPADVRALHGDLAATTGHYPFVGPAFTGVTRRLMRCSASDQTQLTAFLKAYAEQNDDGSDPNVDQQASFSQALFANVIANDILGQLDSWPVDEIAPLDDKMYFAAIAETGYGEMFAAWPRGPLPEDQLVQSSTTVPMLIINGALDRQTVLPWAERAAAHFSGEYQTYAYVPVGGHVLLPGPKGDPSLASICIQDIFAQVLATPLASPNMDCLGDWNTLDYEGANQPTLGASFFLFGTADIYNDSDMMPEPREETEEFARERAAFWNRIGKSLRANRQRRYLRPSVW